MTKSAKIAASAVVLAALLGGLATPAAAQFMGNRGGYQFPARNPGLAAQYQFLRDQQNGGGGGGGGMGALNQYVNTTTYNSSSTSVANMTTMDIGDGSTVMTQGDQVSDGSQTSDADEINVDQSMTNSGNVETESETAGKIADILSDALSQ